MSVQQPPLQHLPRYSLSNYLQIYLPTKSQKKYFVLNKTCMDLKDTNLLLTVIKHVKVKGYRKPFSIKVLIICNMSY